jgi:uncharacterized membrane protein YeaQ/YmgE (transglycosylase-associated protein family)
MDMGFILWLVVGGIAGYIAERLMKENHPIYINIALGIAGSAIINIVVMVVQTLPGGHLAAQLVTGVIGACALIFAYREYDKRR